MNADKAKEKIRKLLALSQSDNPHEAERAKSQAESLMKKHKLSEAESLLVTIYATVETESKSYMPTKAAGMMLSAIEHISGCYCLFEPRDFTRRFKTPKPNPEYLIFSAIPLPEDPEVEEIYHCVPKFYGPKHDAEIAAYTWDVLYKQLKEHEEGISDHILMNEHLLADYSFAWVLGSCSKLVAAFGHKKQSKEVKSFKEKYEIDGSVMKETVDESDLNVDPEMAHLGYHEGNRANLFIGANRDPEKMRLEKFGDDDGEEK